MSDTRKDYLLRSDFAFQQARNCPGRLSYRTSGRVEPHRQPQESARPPPPPPPAMPSSFVKPRLPLRNGGQTKPEKPNSLPVLNCLFAALNKQRGGGHFDCDTSSSPYKTNQPAAVEVPDSSCIMQLNTISTSKSFVHASQLHFPEQRSKTTLRHIGNSFTQVNLKNGRNSFTRLIILMFTGMKYSIQQYSSFFPG